MKDVKICLPCVIGVECRFGHQFDKLEPLENSWVRVPALAASGSSRFPEEDIADKMS
jgi:hypothetical protein